MLALLTVAMLCVMGRLPWFVMAAYGVMSLVSFATYGWDKRQATQGRWRTRERTLLAIDLFCGWPGGLVGQRLWRHKHVKTSYQILFWLLAFLNAAAVGVMAMGWR